MKSFFKKLITKYQVILLNKDSLEEKTTFSINKLHIGLVFLFVFLFCFFTSLLLVLFSPIGRESWGYTKKQEIVDLYAHVDSIESLLNKQINYTENLKLVLESDVVNNNKINHQETVFSLKSLGVEIMEKDSSLKSYIQRLDVKKIIKYNKKILYQLGLSSPLKGLVTSSFNKGENHFGVDIAAKKNSEIKSVLSGVVILSGFSKDYGNFIIINHQNEFSSVYLHCSSILKKQGELVVAGEAIALVGTTGRLSSAPHLHFELWSNGVPIDPEKYIDFK